jgi:uncharacterized protein YndB with AHSA1/START domain
MAEKEIIQAKKTDLVITRIFNAPREQVWKAWTDPEHLKKWWGPAGYSCPDCTIDFRVGGKYLFSMQDSKGNKIWSTGEYREIIHPEKIVCTDSFADENGNVVSSEHYGMYGVPMEMIVTVILEDENGKTKMTMIHAGLPAGEQYDGATAGWDTSFDKLAESLKY